MAKLYIYSKEKKKPEIELTGFEVFEYFKDIQAINQIGESFLLYRKRDEDIKIGSKLYSHNNSKYKIYKNKLVIYVDYDYIITPPGERNVYIISTDNKGIINKISK